MPELGEKRGLWLRYLSASLIVIAVTAAATSFTVFNTAGKIASAIGGNRLKLGNALDPVAAGKPQTILLIGSDKRASSAIDARIFGSGARSDTMILARLDPSKNATALLSLPRDLKVTIPGHGVDKLNAAYAMGGAKLTLKTIKQLTGIHINHVINVDFRGFRDAVNAIGCVYADVDRHYYNASGAFAKIDVPAGYQKICGAAALDYVRYRHTDNDIVRSARQQDFLRQAKGQVGVSRLLDNQNQLAKVFGKYTQSDIHTSGDVLKLLDLVIASAGHPIREVHFQANIGPSYVTASQSDIQQSIQQLLGVQASNGPRGPVQKKPGGSHPQRSSHGGGGSNGLVNAASAGRQQALAAVRGGVRGLPVYYPTRILGDSVFDSGSRAYEICGPHGKCWSSYRMVIARNLIGEYYGLQGTRWKDPPILKQPTQTIKRGHRTFLLFMDGDRVRVVAWQTNDGTYWVTNTLLQTLSRAQMLTIARTAKPLG